MFRPIYAPVYCKVRKTNSTSLSSNFLDKTRPVFKTTLEVKSKLKNEQYISTFGKQIVFNALTVQQPQHM